MPSNRQNYKSCEGRQRGREKGVEGGGGGGENMEGEIVEGGGGERGENVKWERVEGGEMLTDKTLIIHFFQL